MDLASTLEADFDLTEDQSFAFLNKNATEFYRTATPEEREAYLAEIGHGISTFAEGLSGILASIEEDEETAHEQNERVAVDKMNQTTYAESTLDRITTKMSRLFLGKRLPRVPDEEEQYIEMFKDLERFPTSTRYFNALFDRTKKLASKGIVNKLRFWWMSAVYSNPGDYTTSIHVEYTRFGRYRDSVSIGFFNIFDDSWVSAHLLRLKGNLTAREVVRLDAARFASLGHSKSELKKGLSSFEPYSLDISGSTNDHTGKPTFVNIKY